MTSFGVVDHFAAPGLNHAGQHVGELSVAHTVVGEYLGIMASDVLYYAQRLSSEAVDELVLHLRLKVETELIDDVAGMDDVVWHFEFALAGVPQILASLLF